MRGDSQMTRRRKTTSRFSSKSSVTVHMMEQMRGICNNLQPYISDKKAFIKEQIHVKSIFYFFLLFLGGGGERKEREGWGLKCLAIRTIFFQDSGSHVCLATRPRLDCTRISDWLVE